ncbi:MAG: TIM-barrel domain-containing protein [Acidobacteriota bacterium]
MCHRSLRVLSAFSGCLLLVASGAVAHTDAQTMDRVADGVIVHARKGVVRVQLCTDRVVHIIAGETEATRKDLVPTVVEPCSGVAFTTSSRASAFQVRTSQIVIRIDKSTGAVQFSDLAGHTLLGEPSDGGRNLGSDVSSEFSHGIQQTFLLSPDEALYGLGQHQEGFFNVRDIPIRLLQANTNIATPFLISTKGYGLLWNNAALTDFDPPNESIALDDKGEGSFTTGPEGIYGFLLCGNFRKKLFLSVNGQKVIDLENMWVAGSGSGKMHLAANTTYKIVAQTGGDTRLFVRKPSDTMAFRSQAGSSVDYYFLDGPQPSDVIAAYRNLTGNAPLLPRWAYGFWQCRERYSSQQQILDTAAEFRKRQIPVDVLVQDWQYWGKYGWNAMRFDETEYPDPAAMMSELHRQDLHMVISVWAKFGAETAVDQQFKAAHLVLTSTASTGEPGESAERENWADLFNPQAQKMFWSDINRNLFRDGLDGWWLDASEPEGDPLRNDDTYLGPGTIVRNAFPLFETSAVYHGQRSTDKNKRVVILSRSAYPGQQRNASISWSGDISANWETLRRQIPAGLSFSMSGFPYWTTDIGGFFRPQDQYTSEAYHELLIRWFEFGAFCPIFRIHGFHSRTEMWNYGPEVEKDLTAYDRLRYRLLPYIYSTAWQVTNRGESIMKSLPALYPNDISLRDVDNQYFFGDSLLVNPVTDPGATSRSIVLPPGDNWIDFWTGRTYRGGQSMTADAPLDRIPILVKSGSIVPMGPVVQSAAASEDPLEIRVYGGNDASFDLYEDSGDGYAYEKGAHSVIPMRWDDRHRTLIIGDAETGPAIAKPAHTLRIVLVGPGHGLGLPSEENCDRIVKYEGKRIVVKLKGAPRPS